MKIGVVGHRTYFENHFPEGWDLDRNVLCLDVDERDYGWLRILHNWAPDITIFYRAELYPRTLVSRVPGIRVAVLSEPIPAVVDGKLQFTEESRRRVAVYSGMAWDAYHWRVFYDAGRRAEASHLGYPIDEFEPLPIDTSAFYPDQSSIERDIDICFVGKPTPHRMQKLQKFIQSPTWRFLWIAHGVSGKSLGDILRRSRVVLNVHGDAVPALEPRVELAAACGATVLTEPLSYPPVRFRSNIVEASEWSDRLVDDLLCSEQRVPLDHLLSDLAKASCRGFIDRIASRFGLESPSRDTPRGSWFSDDEWIAPALLARSPTTPVSRLSPARG